MDALLDRAFRNNANVMIGKFTCLVLNTANYSNGCAVPTAANAGPVAGVAQESIIPNGWADYQYGAYTIVSGTAWPPNTIPDNAQGRNIDVRMAGLTYVVVASPIAVGDRVNIADNQGRIKRINEAAGTTVHEVGFALEAATQAGTVIKIMMTNIVRVA
jgi:hypothetical protein